MLAHTLQPQDLFGGMEESGFRLNSLLALSYPALELAEKSSLTAEGRLPFVCFADCHSN